MTYTSAAALAGFVPLLGALALLPIPTKRGAADPGKRRRGGIRRLGRPPAPLPRAPAGACWYLSGAAEGSCAIRSLESGKDLPPALLKLVSKHIPTAG